MTTLEFSQAIACAFGWTVVHSLWQIALLYVLNQMAHRGLAPDAARQYAANLLAMLAAAAAAVATFVRYYQPVAEVHFPVHNAGAAAPEMTPFPATAPVNFPSMAESPLQIAANWLDAHAALIGWFWLAGVVLVSLRLLGGYCWALNLRRRHVQHVAAAYADLCAHLAAKMGIKKAVAFRESHRISEPVTLGFLKPIILFPVGMLLQLNTEQVEALLLHELAHIRRADYLVNLLQLFLEACFFYHPLFWLLSKETRDLREYACDTLALRYHKNKVQYAHTLTVLKINQLQFKNQFVMQATGKYNFAARIRRIVGETPPPSSGQSILVLLLLLFVAVAGWASKRPEPNEMHPAPIIEKLETTPAVIIHRDSTPPTKPAIPQKTWEPSISVDPEMMNVLYIGVDNPITVAVQGYDPDEIRVELTHLGKLTYLGQNKYNVVVYDPVPMGVQVFLKKSKTDQPIAVKWFRVRNIPDPNGQIPTNEQEKVLPRTDITIEGDYQVVVSPEKLNVLYIGVDNPVRVAVNSVPNAELEVILTGCGANAVPGLQKGQYYIRVSKPGEVLLEVFQVQKSGKKLLGSKTFRVKRIPDPVAAIAGQPVGQIKISKEALLEKTGIVPFLPNFEYSVQCDIVSFKCATVIPKSVTIVEHLNQGGKFDERVKKLLSEVTPGTKVYFDEIKLRCPGDAADRMVNTIMLEVE